MLLVGVRQVLVHMNGVLHPFQVGYVVMLCTFWVSYCALLKLRFSRETTVKMGTTYLRKRRV